MQTSNIRMMRYFKTQDTTDLFLCKSNGRVYARLPLDNEQVQWFTTSKWSGGYELDCHIRAGVQMVIRDAKGGIFATEVTCLMDRGDNRTYARKECPSADEQIKAFAEALAEGKGLSSYDDWKAWLLEDFTGGDYQDNWVFASSELLRKEKAPVGAVYGHYPVYLITEEQKHTVCGKQWTRYDLVDCSGNTLAMCGFKYKNHTTGGNKDEEQEKDVSRNS